MVENLSWNEKKILLHIARDALTHAVQQKTNPELKLKKLPRQIQNKGASFVTLTINGNLRGCIGSIEAVEPLAADVRRHAVDAGLSDPRFPPVEPDELEAILIEISILTTPLPLECPDPAARADCLKPGIDGVLIRSGIQRSTFLPQVWEKLPEPEQFLEYLCQKAYLPPQAWKQADVELLTYQVIHFDEELLTSSSE